MLKRLQLDMTFIIALTVMSQVTNLEFLRVWGKFSDHFSNKSVLGVSGPLFLACIFAWTFTTMPEKYAGTISHPRRRRIITYLMILGNAGIVSVIATFVVSLRAAGIFRSSLNKNFV